MILSPRHETVSLMMWTRFLRNRCPLIWIPVAIVIGFIIAFVIVGGMKKQLKTVRFRPKRMIMSKAGSMNIVDNQEWFLYQNIVKTEKPKDNDKSSGGSLVHILRPSGSTHGGGGFKFLMFKGGKANEKVSSCSLCAILALSSAACGKTGPDVPRQTEAMYRTYEYAYGNLNIQLPEDADDPEDKGTSLLFTDPENLWTLELKPLDVQNTKIEISNLDSQITPEHAYF